MYFCERIARWFYDQFIVPRVSDALILQRIKLTWYVCGYGQLRAIP